MMLGVEGKKVLVCVAGGIAAFKVVTLVRSLSAAGAEVHVLMTRSARRFIGEQTFASMSDNRVSTDLFGSGSDVPHVELARDADLCIVAPATANVLAKMAHGLADDLVSATLLTVGCPVLVAPAMHAGMWINPATQENVRTLTGRGLEFIGPETGALSSGDEGPGRMSEPEDVAAAAERLLRGGTDLSGRSVLVTAGGTEEPIDPVRFIANRSSGRMGYEIARAAVRRGADVVLVSAPTHLSPPPGVEVVAVTTAAEMHAAVLARALAADVIIKAAAVADFRPERAAGTKIKKSGGVPELRLVPNPDILAELGEDPSLRKTGAVLVGFAAETESGPERLAAYAEEKLRSKKVDLIVANDVASPDSGFAVTTDRAVIASESGVKDLGLVTKGALADELLDRVVGLLENRARMRAADQVEP